MARPAYGDQGQSGPDPIIAGTWIDVTDLTAMLAGATGFPPMLGGERAFDGPDCPWAP